MQEIKFRAFIKKEKIIADVIFLDFIHREVTLKVKGEDYDYDFDQVELMQYIGQYDHKGVEIFEGDRVLIQKADDEGRFIECKVVFDSRDSSFILQKMEDEDICYNIDEPFIVEVIGNVYENPELLEAKS